MVNADGLIWLIAGEAGYGISTAGEIFAKTCMHVGLNVFTNTEYPSLIRGGHNTFMVRASRNEINAHSDSIDLLVALNNESIAMHSSALNESGGIIFDPDVCKNVKSEKAKLYPIPFTKILSEINAEKIMVNSIAVGASAALLGINFEHIEHAIEAAFKKKAESIEQNIVAAQAGYSHVKNSFPEKLGIAVNQKDSKGKMLLTGNDALALGAIVAGCKFAAIYPMTPITSILHRFAAWERTCNFVVLQPEDEISGINAAIGASFTGVRSLVATSGGGFALMSEALGMSGMTETPLVVIWGQRPGPSTGLPTKTSQADLQFAVHASQGEFPRIVLAPGDVEECFHASQEAFNLADRWQLPVIILVDKHVCECHRSIESLKAIRIDRGATASDEELSKASEGFPRYKVTANGVSPRAFPGQKNGIFRAVSDEHDEFGYLTEDPVITAKMQEKRMRKLDFISKELPEPQLHGPSKSHITIIGWGSIKGPVLDALPLLKSRGISANFLHLYHIWPFPSGAVSRAIDSVAKVVCIEQNATGQMASLIREQTGKSVDTLLKYDGRQWTPEKVADAVEELLNGVK